MHGLEPGRGMIVRDLTRDKVGEVMAVGSCGRLHLRPVGGGVEWEAEPGTVELLPLSEGLREKVRELNARDSGKDIRRW